jgi:hypothetical protein
VKNTIAVFYFLLLTIEYSNCVPHAKQTLKKTLKKKMPHYYEKDAACTSDDCVNEGCQPLKAGQPSATNCIL